MKEGFITAIFQAFYNPSLPREIPDLVDGFEICKYFSQELDHFVTFSSVVKYFTISYSAIRSNASSPWRY